MATYRPEIDQSQYTKSVSHIITCNINVAPKPLDRFFKDIFFKNALDVQTVLMH